MKRSIAVVTGTRAEYGLLKPLLRRLCAEPSIALRLLVTGTHLSPRFGSTVREIERDGFPIAARIPMHVGADTPDALAVSMAYAQRGCARFLATHRTDMIVVLGDRYELLPIVSSALVARVPVAHLHGGEVTEGAFDDAIRHAVTKMSHLHFTATDECRRRVIQLGEQPKYVFTVGALGIDAIKDTPVMDKQAFERAVGIRLRQRNLLVTIHPSTLDDRSPREQCQVVLDALGQLRDTALIFTYANADPGGQAINRSIEAFVSRHAAHAVCVPSLGQQKYYSALHYVDAVVGNSSSGILEAPSFRIGTIDIGDRQKGRMSADSVIHCPSSTASIAAALRTLYTPRFQSIVRRTDNPYGKGTAARSIVRVLTRISFDGLVRKKFYDVKRCA